jgi:hypothetical protein
MVPNHDPRHSGYVSSAERTNRSHTQGEMKMKKLFVSSLLTALAVPVMFAQTTPAPDTKPTTTTKSTTKAKKHSKKTTAPAAASSTKTASPVAPKS